MPHPTPLLRHIFTVRADLANILDVGPTPAGHRRVINILAGTVTGPRLTGKVLPGGADWQIVRPDGALDIEARYTLQADDGALIQVRSSGLRHGAPEVLARVVRGDPVDPGEYYFRTLMRFETAAPKHDWLNRILAIAYAARMENAVELHVHE
ncbi:MAG TPA: DUF3237 domain-containing protein, partial [bacterium]